MSAKDSDIQRSIDAAILNSPWNDYSNTTNKSGNSVQDIIISQMRLRGFRPIRVDEYRALQQKGRGMRLWIPTKGTSDEHIALDLTFDTEYDSLNATTSPSSTQSSAAVYESQAGAVTRDDWTLTSSSEATLDEAALTQLETEAWPTIDTLQYSD